LLKSKTGEWKPILSIEKVAGTNATYNFEVQQNHDYFVGESGWLVHNQSSVALDTNALIPLLEGSSSDAAAVTSAIGNRTPQVSFTAAREFLRGGGDANALRGFLQNTGGRIGPAPSSTTINNLMSNGIRANDARVLGSAIDQGIPLLTRDRRLLNRYGGTATGF
jgi:hypothetical protein